MTLSWAVCFNIAAQESSSIKSKEFSLGVGSVLYNGDLGDGYQPGGLMGSVGIKMNTEKKLNSNFHILFGSFSGQELDFEFPENENGAPNTYFNTSFFGVHYELAFNIINKPRFKLYISQGLGFVRFQPKDEFGEKLINQPDTRDLGEDYRNLTFMLPSQIGVRYTLNNGYSLGLQSGFLNTMTDYLDNISIWGQKDGNDNLLNARFLIFIPIEF